MSNKYKNKMIINQRGGSIVIDNSTDKESVQISQRSGSNININNVVNSELATNNKQTLILNDAFEDTRNDRTENVGGVLSVRVGENNYNIKGFKDLSEIEAYKKWKDSYKEVALENSKFKIKRGGASYPHGVFSEKEGKSTENPTLNNDILSVENEFTGYSRTPIRSSVRDDVSTFANVPDVENVSPASIKKMTPEELAKSTHPEIGSGAPGVLKYGASKSSSTEGGEWEEYEDKIEDLVLEKSKELLDIEKMMGNGGDDVEFVKRNKFETVGAVFNDYPSIRVDPEGRSQPLEMLVSDVGVFKNHDSFPIVEEVDNSSNFPCGNDSKIIGNSYRRDVGSGGISLKTTGSFEIGSATLNIGSKKIHINANLGIQIASESYVEIQSLKSIILRSNRQVLVEASLGVANNLIVGGGIYSEGENYFHHITAPLEVQQTQDTTIGGQFNVLEDRSLLIGEALIAGTWYPVYAKASPDLIACYPHSHHFNNLPLRLTASNKDLRDIAQREGVNKLGFKNQALPQIHARKLAIKTT